MTDTDAINAALAKHYGWLPGSDPRIDRDMVRPSWWDSSRLPLAMEEMRPATDYGQALRLAEKELILVAPNPDGTTLGKRNDVNGSGIFVHESPPIAICLAVLAKYGVEL